MNDHARIECVITGGPVQHVRWLKDGSLIMAEQLSIEKPSSVLNIDRVNSTSQGMYQCFVANEFETKQASGQLILSGNTSIQ